MAKEAKGEYLLILCDDDKLDPYFLEKTVGWGTDIVRTDMEFFDHQTGTAGSRPFTIETFRETTSPFITSLVKRELFLELGGCDAEQIYFDYDFWYRCFKRGVTEKHIPETLFKYRIHDPSSPLHSNVNHQQSQLLITNKNPELL